MVVNLGHPFMYSSCNIGREDMIDESWNTCSRLFISINFKVIRLVNTCPVWRTSSVPRLSTMNLFSRHLKATKCFILTFISLQSQIKFSRQREFALRMRSYIDEFKSETLKPSIHKALNGSSQLSKTREASSWGEKTIWAVES